MRRLPRDLQAAIVLENGQVFAGPNHGFAMMEACKGGLGEMAIIEEGFECKEWGFLDRVETQVKVGGEWEAESIDLGRKFRCEEQLGIPDWSRKHSQAGWDRFRGNRVW